MEDQLRQRIIRENPIGTAFSGIRSVFNSTCDAVGIQNDSNALDKLDQDTLQELVFQLLSLLIGLRASRLLPSIVRGKKLVEDIAALISAVSSRDFDFAAVKLLLAAVIDEKNDDEIWDQVYEAVSTRMLTPPLRSSLSSTKDTPFCFTSEGTVGSSQRREFLDFAIREELGAVRVDLDIYGTFFEPFPGLETAAALVFEECCQGNEPLFNQGWRDWPEDASESNVLVFLEAITQHLAHAAQDRISTTPARQRLKGLSQRPWRGSIAARKVDVAFVSDETSDEEEETLNHWGQILVAGELKKNPDEDTLASSWLDLARYAREVFNAQDTRRFLLGFTLCGSIMRIWNFDRMGAIGSAKIDINHDGLRFVSIMLGFIFMDQEALGLDPSIMTSGNKRYVEIDDDGQKKHLYLDRLVSRSRGIVTRATTCWAAHFEEEPQVRLLLKESWQPPQRNEGDLLRLATEHGVMNIARHCHNWTVRINDRVDDVQNNIRKGLNLGRGKKAICRVPQPQLRSSASTLPSLASGNQSAGTKRTLSQAGLAEPLSRLSRSASRSASRSESPTKQRDTRPDNRVHQRIVMRDCGRAIYTAGSLAELLEALAQCVAGHKALYDVGILHRDISLNNVLINEDRSDPSHLGLLIDLDLAVKLSREEASGASLRTGTRAFMSMGVLFGNPHSFMDDLESFFWVLFWICIHFRSPSQYRTIEEFEEWSYTRNPKQVAGKKLGVIGGDQAFEESLDDHVTPYYRPLVPCLRRLWRLVFPEKEGWKTEDEGLYQSIQDVLRDAKNDPGVKMEDDDVVDVLSSVEDARNGKILN